MGAKQLSANENTGHTNYVCLPPFLTVSYTPAVKMPMNKEFQWTLNAWEFGETQREYTVAVLVTSKTEENRFSQVSKHRSSVLQVLLLPANCPPHTGEPHYFGSISVWKEEEVTCGLQAAY